MERGLTAALHATQPWSLGDSRVQTVVTTTVRESAPLSRRPSDRPFAVTVTGQTVRVDSGNVYWRQRLTSGPRSRGRTGSAVEHLTHLAQELLRRERLLEIRRTGLEDALLAYAFLGVAGD